jgi:glycosyltransferase involved in cell wall biosynthesis
MGPRILTFTSLFPNARQPMHGPFVRERIRALAAECRLEVVAPVPWVPPLPGLGPRYAVYREIASTEHDHGITIYHPRFFVVPKVLKTFDGLFMGASCLAPVARIRRSFPFDLIDAHWAYPDGVAAAYIAARLRVPFAVTVRGDDINIFAEERGRGPMIRWMLRRASLVIALSEDLKARVEWLTGGHPHVVTIRNGINPDRFRPVDPAAARGRLGLAAGTRVCVSVGRLHASKGIDVLVDALARLPAHAPCWRTEPGSARRLVQRCRVVLLRDYA